MHFRRVNGSEASLRVEIEGRCANRSDHLLPRSKVRYNLRQPRSIEFLVKSEDRFAKTASASRGATILRTFYPPVDLVVGCLSVDEVTSSIWSSIVLRDGTSPQSERSSWSRTHLARGHPTVDPIACDSRRRRRSRRPHGQGGRTRRVQSGIAPRMPQCSRIVSHELV